MWLATMASLHNNFCIDKLTHCSLTMSVYDDGWNESLMMGRRTSPPTFVTRVSPDEEHHYIMLLKLFLQCYMVTTEARVLSTSLIAKVVVVFTNDFMGCDLRCGWSSGWNHLVFVVSGQDVLVFVRYMTELQLTTKLQRRGSYSAAIQGVNLRVRLCGCVKLC